MTMTIGAVICVVVIAGGIAGFGLVLLFSGTTTYPPAAAEAPEPDVEFERARPLTEVGPLVVAGSDLDRAHQPMALVNLTLRLMVDADPELAALRTKPAELAELYVAPEVER